MILTTERLRLRDFEPEDWASMLRIESDPEAVRYQSYEPRTETECREYLAKDLAARGDARCCFDLAVTLEERVIGRIGLDVNCPERRVGELWFILERASWGRGLMPEAARRMVDLGFAELGLHRVFLECDPRNAGWCDALFFGLLAAEWPAIHEIRP